MQPKYFIEHFTAIGKTIYINVFGHIFPTLTRAFYSSERLVELAKLRWMTATKLLTCEASQYYADILAPRDAALEKTILACDDGCLLTLMVQGIHCALVSCKSFVAELTTALYAAVCKVGPQKAQKIQSRIYGLKQVIYAAGKPTGDVHGRMTVAMYYAEQFKSTTARPPTQLLTGEYLDWIKKAFQEGHAAKRSGRIETSCG